MSSFSDWADEYYGEHDLTDHHGEAESLRSSLDSLGAAYSVAKRYAVAVKVDGGEYVSIRAQDFHRLDELFRGM